MLRAVLGVCGVSLIAFGVFGGQMLENLHRGINGLFTPATVVVEASSKPVTLVSSPVPVAKEAVVAAQTDDPVVLLAASDTGSEQPLVLDKQPPVLEITTAMADPVVTPAVPVVTDIIALPEAAGKIVQTASAATDSALADAQDIALKEEGVAMVLSSTNGLPNNNLFVLKDRVNMREGPSTEHAIVLQLEMGQELMEFKRDGKWVHVGAYGTSGKIGWVHSTLVGGN